MSRVALNMESRTEFFMDFSEIENENERAVAFILLMNYKMEIDKIGDWVYQVDYRTLYREAEKYGITITEVDEALDALEEKEFVCQFMTNVSLEVDDKNSTTKCEMSLGKTGEIKLGQKKVKLCDTTSQTQK
jgi:hypothetical protein